MLGILSHAPRECDPLASPGHALWVQVVICQLQLVVVAKAAQDGPGGLVPAPLDEEGVEEEEACRRDQGVQPQWSQFWLRDPLLRAMLSLGKQTAGTERQPQQACFNERDELGLE